MFGTVAKMRIKPGADVMLMAWSRALLMNIKGHVSTTIYRSVEDPQVLWMTVVFEDEASYRANAESPEQHRRWQQMRSVVEDDIEWSDGHILSHGNAQNHWAAPKPTP